MIAKLYRGPGRPRIFDIQTALDVGQGLFHAHGYEGVGLAALTDAIGIKPPSFYKAFGSKAAFFGLVLDRYAHTVLAMDTILTPGRPPAEALLDLLESAARTYACDPERLGCLVLEAVRGGEAEAASLARRTATSRRDQIRAFVASTHPNAAVTVTDYVASTMSGLSASAREGMDDVRLIAVAHAAAAGLVTLLPSSGNSRPFTRDGR